MQHLLHESGKIENGMLSIRKTCFSKVSCIQYIHRQKTFM